MGGAGDDPARMGTLQSARAMSQPLGQVDAVRADLPRQGRVRADQELEAPGAGDGQQAPRTNLGVWSPEVAIDDGASGGQPGCNALRVGSADRVGEEQQRRQGLPQAPPRR
jgi:hypothetical protein